MEEPPPGASPLSRVLDPLPAAPRTTAVAVVPPARGLDSLTPLISTSRLSSAALVPPAAELPLGLLQLPVATDLRARPQAHTLSKAGVVVCHSRPAGGRATARPTAAAIRLPRARWICAPTVRLWGARIGSERPPGEHALVITTVRSSTVLAPVASIPPTRLVWKAAKRRWGGLRLAHDLREAPCSLPCPKFPILRFTGGYPSIPVLPQPRFLVGCSSRFMRLAKHLTALRAWCEHCLHGASSQHRRDARV